MAFQKKTWLARLGQGLNKFSIDGATPVPIINQPDSVTQQGDALSAGNLNDLEQRIADAFDDVEESKADKSTTEELQSQINQQEARIENLEQKAGDYSVVQYRGTDAVPTGKAKYGLVEKIVGKTRAWNQLVDTDTSSVTLISGHKYLTVINGSFSIVTGAGTAISVTGGTDCVYDLTLIFGAGNEPSSVADAIAQLPVLGLYNAYDDGSLVSTVVSGVESRDTSDNLLDTLSLSETVTLRSAGSVADELDVESGVIKRKVGSVDLGTLEWSRTTSYDAPLFYANLNDKAQKQVIGMLCGRYTFSGSFSGAQIFASNSADKSIGDCYSNKQVFVRDDAYTDAATFKTAMSSVMLNYELATPTTDPIDPITDNFIQVQGSGTIDTVQTQTPVIDNSLDVGYLAV